MNSEDMIDNTIASLKIISMIPKNGRLSIKKGQLTLETDDHFQRLRRWLMNDSRQLTLMHIKNTINNAIKLSRGIVDNKIETELKKWSLSRLTNEMQNCKHGLLNLKTTYSEDSLMIANLDVITDRLTAHCEELHVYLNLPKESIRDKNKPT